MSRLAPSPGSFATAAACPSNEDALALHASGDLEPAAATAMRRHLDTCAGCRAVLQEYRATSDWLRGHRPAGIAAPVLDELQRRIADQLPGRRQAPWLLAWLGRIREANRGSGGHMLAISMSGTAALALAALGALASGGPGPRTTWSGLASGPAAMVASSAQPGTASPPAPAGDDPGNGGLRIEMQTGDPDVRIIWFASASEPNGGEAPGGPGLVGTGGQR